MPAKNTNAKPIQERRAEFSIKSDLLAAHFQPLSPMEYYTQIFGNTEGRRVYVIENKTYKTATVDELMEIMTFRADIYVPPCDFFNDYYRKITLSKHYALVVDIDQVMPLALEQLIMDARSKRFIMPTMIGNSGSGLHLYFVFSSPVEMYARRVPILMAMARALGVMYQGYGRVDRYNIIQSYRLAGARTKLGDTMTGYRAGRAYNALELAHRLGVDTSSWEGGSTMQKPPKSEQEQREALPQDANKVIPQRWAWDGTKLWDYCTWRVFRDTKNGNRYYSMMALAAVGKKCGVKRADVQAKLETLAAIWTERTPDDPVEIEEVTSAMTMYNWKYAKIGALKLEELFGWTFERKIKRRPPKKRLKQKEHLRRCNIVKHALQADDKQQSIRTYLTAHPGASQREVAREIGMSRNTVAKYWPGGV